MTHINFKLKKSRRYIVWRGFYHSVKIVWWLVSINTTLYTRIRRKRQREISKAGDCSFLGQIWTIRTAIYQPPESLELAPVIFFFPFFRSRYEILLLIVFFFLLDRFRFDSFLFWVLGEKNSCWCGSGFQYSEEDPPSQAIRRFFATDRGGEA